MDTSVQMPEFIAGDRSEVTPDSDGAENVFSVGGGITLFLLVLMGAIEAKDRITQAATESQNPETGGISLKGEL